MGRPKVRKLRGLLKRESRIAHEKDLENRALKEKIEFLEASCENAAVIEDVLHKRIVELEQRPQGIKSIFKNLLGSNGKDS
jgi:hypothetical protein